jgi:hypothetical protein
MKKLYLLLITVFAYNIAHAGELAIFDSCDKFFLRTVPIAAKKSYGVVLKDPSLSPFDKTNIEDLKREEIYFLEGIDKPFVIEDIDAIIANAPDNFFGKLLYAAKEGAGDENGGFGEMDFRYALEFYDEDRLYLIDGIAYNVADLGNYLWGVAMARMKIPYPIAKLGSEANAFFFTYEQNEFLKKPWHGLSLTGDSRADQRAIRRGYFGSMGKNTRFNKSID